MDIAATIAATSTEYIHIPVTATIAGTPIALAVPPKMAFMPTSGNPATEDWLDAEWVGTQARLLIGPTGGAVTLEAGTYSVWIHFAAGLETPVYKTGRLTVY